MITQHNFKDAIARLDVNSFSPILKEMHDFVLDATQNATDWSAYQDPDVRSVIDNYFIALNKHLDSKTVAPKSATVRAESKPKAEPRPKSNPSVKPVSKRAPVEHKPVETEEQDFELVERIPDEIKIIRRFLSFDGKKKTKDDFLRFINYLHKAILEKRVRITSPYSKQINYIQTNLVKTYNKMTKALPVKINASVVAEFKELIASEKVMASVQLMKRYINLNGKYGVKDKAAQLMESMKRAFENGKINKKDKYIGILDRMHANLKKYVKNKAQKILSIEQTELNGLNGALNGYGVEGFNEEPELIDELHGIETEQSDIVEEDNTQPEVMNSLDFKKVQFIKLGFRGKYLSLIGDPSAGFTAMVFGKPKMGKSILCIDFAGYLARHHGKVLYIAKEEGLDRTLQDKLNAKDVAHQNLDVANRILDDLTPYNFIFIDSVNSLGLSTDDLKALKQNNPGKSFIYVFQTTKEGNFRGANEFQHDVDIVIEVPEVGKAVQHGRFNQGGEMDIFDEGDYEGWNYKIAS